ncbi:putative serine/threonine-protein kinase irlF-like [Capsicum annuum]|nr:putative serine/threonine-protein kinase irlF-like [Capsicum annuum]KAF3678846.1 putative serine/threonine-protein kinase irlF-like [Capsicum annuum]
MKTILLFLSLAIILPLSALATCATTDTPTNQVWLGVRDTNGKPLNASNRYWILPAYTTMDIGGVRLANLDDQQQTITCPTSVVLSNLPKDDGIAVYFTPKNPNKYQLILASSPLNIHFYFDYPLCSNFAVWKVDNLVSKWPPILHTISTGAKLGNPNDFSSWFQIKPLGRNYKLVFCLESTTYCRDIGFVRQNGYRRLVLSEKPMPFVFKLDDRIGMASCYA